MASVQLSWAGDALATYDVYYRLKLAPLWTVASGSPVTGLSTTITGLDADSLYEFKVVGKCGNPLLFTLQTNAGGCLAPTGVVTSNVTSSTVTVSWSGNAERVEWKQASASLWETAQVVSGSTSFTISALQQGTAYQIRVINVCGAGVQSTSTTVITNTTAVQTLCANIAVTSPVITLTLPNIYTVTWVNSGTPASVSIEASLSNVAFTEPVAIQSQTPTSITYSLPLNNSPITHYIRLTPVCSDGSTGTPATATYNSANNVTTGITLVNNSGLAVSNLAVNGLLPSVSLPAANGASRFVPSNFLPLGASSIMFEGLFASAGSYRANLTRGGTTTAIGDATVVNGVGVISNGTVFSNGDTVTLIQDTRVRINGTVLFECVNGDCTRQGSTRIVVNLTQPLQNAITLRLALGYRDTTLNTNKIYGCDLFNGNIPSSYTCDSFCNNGYDIVIPSGVTTFTSPLLTCQGNPSIQAPCQPCTMPLQAVWIQTITPISTLITLSGTTNSGTPVSIFLI